MMNYPVAVSRIQSALPHRPPMIWIDEVLAAAADGGVCAVDLRPDGLYVDEGGGCLAFAPVEWMAEAYGYSRACHAYGEGSSSYGLKRAFLVGVGQLDLYDRIPAEGRILVEVRTQREMAPVVLVKGQVRSEAGEIYAEASLKLYFEE